VPSLVADVREDSSYAPKPASRPWVVTAEPTVPDELKPEAAKAAFDETLLVGVLETLESGEANQCRDGGSAGPSRVAGQALIDLSRGEDVFEPKPKPAPRKRTPPPRPPPTGHATARRPTARAHQRQVRTKTRPSRRRRLGPRQEDVAMRIDTLRAKKRQRRPPLRSKRDLRIRVWPGHVRRRGRANWVIQETLDQAVAESGFIRILCRLGVSVSSRCADRMDGAGRAAEHGPGHTRILRSLLLRAVAGVVFSSRGGVSICSSRRPLARAPAFAFDLGRGLGGGLCRW